MNKKNLLSIKKSLELLIISIDKKEIEAFLALETIRGFRILIYKELSGDELEIFKKAVPYYNPSDMVSYEAEDLYEKAKYTASQLILQISSRLEDWENKIEDLSRNNKKLRRRIEELEKKQKLFIDTINQIKSENHFDISSVITKLLNKENLLWFLEAVQCFKFSAFIACVAMCRVLFENLIDEKCKENSIDISKGLQFKFEELKKLNLITGGYEKISALVKDFGDDASHPNIGKIDKDKANFVLNGVLILIKELFKK